MLVQSAGIGSIPTLWKESKLSRDSDHEKDDERRVRIAPTKDSPHRTRNDILVLACCTSRSEFEGGRGQIFGLPTWSVGLSQFRLGEVGPPSRSYVLLAQPHLSLSRHE